MTVTKVWDCSGKQQADITYRGVCYVCFFITPIDFLVLLVYYAGTTVEVVLFT